MKRGLARDRRAVGFAEPLHDRLRAAGEAAGAAAGQRRRFSQLVRRVAGRRNAH